MCHEDDLPALSFKKAQRMVDEFVSKFKEGYFPATSIVTCIIEEIGEVAKEVLILEKIKSRKIGEKEGSIESELGDVLYCICCLANKYNISLSECFENAMHKFTTRDVNRWTKKQDEEDLETKLDRIDYDRKFIK